MVSRLICMDVHASNMAEVLSLATAVVGASIIFGLVFVGWSWRLRRADIGVLCKTIVT